MIKKIIALVLFLVGAAPADELGKLAESYVAEGAPGVLIYVRDTDGVHIGAAGHLKGADSIFRIASISKTMTSALVLLACQEKKLDLDKPMPAKFRNQLSSRLPGLDRITVRQLLSHRTGLPEYFDDGFADFKKEKSGSRTRPDEALLYIDGEAFVAEPGEEFEYCNTNYVLLGLLVEYVYDSELGAIAQSKLFQPLDMETASYDYYPESSKDVVPGYLVSDEVTKKASILETDDGFGDGGVTCSAPDLDKFLRGLAGGKVLNKKFLSEMTTFNASADGDYGLGLARVRDQGIEGLGHQGSIRAYQSSGFYYPSIDTTVIVFMNGGDDVKDLIHDIVADLSEELGS